MANETFNIGFACAIQVDKDTINVPAAWSTSSVTEAAGTVLGDRDSGDATSGITIPTFERIERAYADIGLTKTGGSFIRVDVTGLGITIQAKGNGVASTPSAGQAKPALGIDALWRASGFAGANGTDPAYVYTPTDTQEYLTVCLWAGTNRYYFKSCIAELTLTPTPAEVALLNFTISVGSHDPATQKFAGVTFPTTFTYGTQSTLSAPVVQAADSTLSTLRDFSDMSIVVGRDIETVPASNADTGQDSRQTARTVSASGTLYVDSADGDYDYENLIAAAPTDDLTFHIGEAAAPTDALNSIFLTLGNVQHLSAKPDRLAAITVIQMASSQARGATVGSELSATYK